MKRLASWLPVAVWMAVIFGFSTGQFSAVQTGSYLRPFLHWLLPWTSDSQVLYLHGLIRKGGHITEYGILAGLWLRALRREDVRPGPATLAAWLVAVVWAALDEWHQAFVPSRTSSPGDVVIDAIGAAIVLGVARLGWRRCVDGAAVVLLWVAAVGGALVLVLNVTAGVGSGVLWLTVPAAAVLLLLLRWRKNYSRS